MRSRLRIPRSESSLFGVFSRNPRAGSRTLKGVMKIVIVAGALVLVLALGALEIFAARTVPDAWLDTPQAEFFPAR